MATKPTDNGSRPGLVGGKAAIGQLALPPTSALPRAGRLQTCIIAELQLTDDQSAVSKIACVQVYSLPAT